MVEMKKIMLQEIIGAILLFTPLFLIGFVGRWNNNILNFLIVLLAIFFPVLFILTIIIFKKIRKD